MTEQTARAEDDAAPPTEAAASGVNKLRRPMLLGQALNQPRQKPIRLRSRPS